MQSERVVSDLIAVRDLMMVEGGTVLREETILKTQLQGEDRSRLIRTPLNAHSHTLARHSSSSCWPLERERLT